MPEQTNTEQRGSVIDDLVEEFTRRVQEGEQLEAEAFAAAHPEHAERLRALLPVAALLAQAGEAGESRGRTDCQSVRDGDGAAYEDGPPEGRTDYQSVLQAHEPISGVLGDFRIVREIGRGGMRVVYEAEQISLRRHVALKVLPFAGILDARQLQRFKNEAQAAAGLHHPHIVPVHAVGVDRGVHYYAMQYIEGRTLADVIAAVRGESAVAPAAGGPHAPTVVGVQPSGCGGLPTPESSLKAGLQSQSSLKAGLQPDTSPIAKLTTDFARNAKAYARRVAEIGIQAAEALDYANQLGIVHRDIKPSNLILDERGEVWVTDFGLAITPTGGALTQTGEMVGTLRYMSPEQLVAERGIIDHRTDVYSLGATLYELLSLRPMWEDAERAKLLQHILTDDPEPLRKRNPAIPVDLETIVLKALEKSSGGRYATAREMGDDLRRFLGDEAIVARKPTLPQKVVKWARRRWGVISTAAICTAVATIVVAALVVRQVQDRADQAAQLATRVNSALNEAILLQGAGPGEGR